VWFPGFNGPFGRRRACAGAWHRMSPGLPAAASLAATPGIS
jgi:hypothetical protein